MSGATTATGLSAMVDGEVSHDRTTRFLAQRDYTSKDLWRQVKSTARGKHFIAALKSNRLVALSEDDRRNKRFVAVDELEFPEHGVVQGWLNG